MQARSVKGCSAARTDVWGQPAFAGPVEGTGAYTGSVKNFGSKGYGFIVMEDGVEMFFNIKDCVGSKPVAGDTVKFDIEESPIKPGSKQAGSHTLHCPHSAPRVIFRLQHLLAGQERHRRKPAFGPTDGHERRMGSHVGWGQGLGRWMGLERRLGWRQGRLGRWWQRWSQGWNDGCRAIRKGRQGYVVEWASPRSSLHPCWTCRNACFASPQAIPATGAVSTGW